MLNRLKTATAAATAAAALCLGVASSAQGAALEAVLAPVGGQTWDASFTVRADPGQTIAAFSVYFDWAQASNLSVHGSPAGWDSIVLQADSALAADGMFDALALGTGMVDSVPLGGFSVRFDWAGALQPWLTYTINDPNTFAVLELGTVSITSATVVPEPPAWVLLGMGLAALLRRRTCG